MKPGNLQRSVVVLIPAGEILIDERRDFCISAPFISEGSFFYGEGWLVRYFPRLTEIDEQEAVRYAGAPDKSVYSQAIVTSICREVLLLLEPVACWEEYDYSAEQRLVLAKELPYALPSCNLAGHLAGAERVTFLAVTVGDAVEDFSRHLFAQGRYSEALLAEGAASAAVEQAADQLCVYLERQYQQQGFALTTRYSPGYGDWSLDEQPNVLRLAKGDTIGVALTKSLMLTPKKSITAIAGWRRRDKTEITQTSNCAACSKLDCTMRKG